MSLQLVEMIKNVVIAKSKPAVYISGGIDSTIILHHLSEKSNCEIYTYHAKFGMEGDECGKARKVAKYYGTKHTEIEITSFVDTLQEVMKFFSRARYNIWPYWLARQAKLDGRENIYIGEGSDEHFGGYTNRDYTYAWASQINYALFTFKVIHSHLTLNLETPFHNLDWKKTIKFYKPPQKEVLREGYKGVILDLFLNVGGRPPAFTNYYALWDKELKQYFPDYIPKSVEDIKSALHFLAVKAWYSDQNKVSKNYDILT